MFQGNAFTNGSFLLGDISVRSWFLGIERPLATKTTSSYEDMFMWEFHSTPHVSSFNPLPWALVLSTRAFSLGSWTSPAGTIRFKPSDSRLRILQVPSLQLMERLTLHTFTFQSPPLDRLSFLLSLWWSPQESRYPHRQPGGEWLSLLGKDQKLGSSSTKKEIIRSATL